MGTGLLQSIGENVQFVLTSAAVIAALIGIAKLVEVKILCRNIALVPKTKYITICAMLGALAMLLHLFDFPVPFLAPGFYKLDFSEIPVMIGAFYLGPVGGIVIELVKILLKLVVPANFATLINALKVNVGLSWVGVIMGEFLVSRAGLGYALL